MPRTGKDQNESRRDDRPEDDERRRRHGLARLADDVDGLLDGLAAVDEDSDENDSEGDEHVTDDLPHDCVFTSRVEQIGDRGVDARHVVNRRRDQR